MHEPYLEVTFRHGQVLAAYYHLPRRPGAVAARSQRMVAGLIVDFDAADAPIGIEIGAPEALTLDAFNGVLIDLGLPPIGREDLSPLRAA